MSIIEDMLPPGVPEKDKAAGLLKDRGDGVLDRVSEGGGGVKYVECHTNAQFQDIQCDLSPEEFIALAENGENIVLKVFVGNTNRYYPLYNILTNVIDATKILVFNSRVIDANTMVDMTIYVAVYPTVSSIIAEVKNYTLTPATP